jgi:hypothetical protein
VNGSTVLRVKTNTPVGVPSRSIGAPSTVRTLANPDPTETRCGGRGGAKKNQTMHRLSNCCARALIGDTAVTLPTTNMNAEQTSIAASERHAPFSFRLSRYTNGGPQYGPKR